MMTAFHPTSITIDPPPESDPLGSAIVAALHRDVALRLTWNLPVALILGLATAGLAPLIVLVLRFRLFATAQRFQLEHVTEWMELSGRDTETLRRTTRSLSSIWPALTIAAIASAVIAVAIAGMHLWRARQDPFSLVSLWMWRGRGDLGVIYQAVMVLGFACHWLAIAGFASQVSRFAAALENPLGAGTVAAESRAPFSGWRWLVAGTVLLLGGNVYGLPMMVAAGAHKRYISSISRVIRCDVAHRIEPLLRPGPQRG